MMLIYQTLIWKCGTGLFKYQLNIFEFPQLARHLRNQLLFQRITCVSHLADHELTQLFNGHLYPRAQWCLSISF